MLLTEIENLVNIIKDEISHFDGNGFYYDPLKENPKGFGGVTDTMDAYFFIQPKPNNHPNEYQAERVDTEGFSAGYIFSTDLVLVAGIKNVNMKNAVTALSSILGTFSDADLSINHISTNSRNIYYALYEKEYSYSNDLILIDFTMSKMVPDLNNCDLELCLGGC